MCLGLRMMRNDRAESSILFTDSSAGVSVLFGFVVAHFERSSALSGRYDLHFWYVPSAEAM